MKKQLIYLLSILCIIGCSSVSNESKNKVSDSEGFKNVEETKMTSNEKKHESFYSFFQNFMWHSDFQKERIIFPLKYGENTIDSKSWVYDPFYSPGQYMPILSSDTLSFIDNDVTDDNLILSIVFFSKKISKDYYFKKNKGKWLLIEIKEEPIIKSKDFPFISFINKFSEDSLFQVNRTVFPIPDYYSDADKDYETIYDSLKIDQWMHINVAEQVEGFMTINFNLKSDFRDFYFRGVENGIYAHYIFKKKNEKWYLVKMEDFST